MPSAAAQNSGYDDVLRHWPNVLPAWVLSGKVFGQHRANVAGVAPQMAVVKQEDAGAELLNGVQIVADKQHGAAGVPGVLHLAQALLLEGGVAHSQHLIHHEDGGVQVSGDGEREPEEHARGVILERRVQKKLGAGEGNDFIELARDFSFADAEHGAVQVNVFAPAEFGMKPGPDVQQ